MTTVIPWTPAHDTALVDILLRLRAVGIEYPHPAATDGTAESLQRWLHDGPALSRWVAVDDAGRVVGHVLVCEPHAYLTKHLPEVGPAGEIGKLFADPDTAGRGAGAALLDTATQSLHARGLVPALAVLPSSQTARRLYDKHGWQEVNRFMGTQGENHVMIRPTPALARTA